MLAQFLSYIFLVRIIGEIFGERIEGAFAHELSYFFGGWSSSGVFGEAWLPSSQLIFILPLLFCAAPRLYKIHAGYWLTTMPMVLVWWIQSGGWVVMIPMRSFRHPPPELCCAEMYYHLQAITERQLHSMYYFVMYAWGTVTIVLFIKLLCLIIKKIRTNATKKKEDF
jgi:hypothetical protein